MYPIGQGLPKGLPGQRQKPGCWGKVSAHLKGSQPLGGKHGQTSRPGRLWGGIEQIRLHSTGPPGAYGLNKNRGPSHWSHGGHGHITFRCDPTSFFLTKKHTIIGATADQAHNPFLVSRWCNLRSHEVRHEFFYLPDCPIGLMGRDLLCKLRPQITFDSDGMVALNLGGPEEKTNPHSCTRKGMVALCPWGKSSWDSWASLKDSGCIDWWQPPRSGPKCAPTSGGTKARSHPHQPKTALHPLQGTQKHFNRLLKYGILWPFQSSWNTPLLSVQKLGTEDFRPVQDLQEVNSATVILHPIVPNPYMFLGLVTAEAKFFTCLYLKDAFFCNHLAPEPAYFCLPMRKSQ
jgi:hypothetical protein